MSLKKPLDQTHSSRSMCQGAKAGAEVRPDLELKAVGAAKTGGAAIAGDAAEAGGAAEAGEEVKVEYAARIVLGAKVGVAVGVEPGVEAKAEAERST